jgi:hypothetical protein
MSNIYKRYTIPVVSLGPDGVQRVVDNFPVECHDHMRMGELGNEIFAASNLQKGGVPRGNPTQTSSGGDDQMFKPDGVATATQPKGRGV